MVSSVLFLPYLAYQKCKPKATTTGVCTTYNCCNSGAAEIHVGGAPREQGHIVPHQGGCSGSRAQTQDSCSSTAITGDEQGDAAQTTSPPFTTETNLIRKGEKP